jgi:hypothetical protein
LHTNLASEDDVAQQCQTCEWDRGAQTVKRNHREALKDIMRETIEEGGSVERSTPDFALALVIQFLDQVSKRVEREARPPTGATILEKSGYCSGLSSGCFRR